MESLGPTDIAFPMSLVSEKLNKVSFYISDNIFHVIPSKCQRCIYHIKGFHFYYSSHLDADVGQISHGRRTEGPQTADHSLSAR